MFLPPYPQLSEEQKGIITRISREQSDLFVEGPPGSGKTVISLYTLRDMIREGASNPLLLIYNHSLYGYLRTSLEELNISENITIATKDKFFWDLASQKGIGRPHGTEYKEKYDYILTNLQKESLTLSYDVAVVDEVQDLDPREWKLLKRLAKRTTSLGDFNQGIYKTNLTQKDIIGDGIMDRLEKIFRFHRNIAKLAAKFSKKKDNLESKVDKISQSKPQIIKVEPSEEYEEIKKILQSLKNERKRIGVICPGRALLTELSEFLKKEGISHDYYPSNKGLRKHNFTSSHPLLITSYSSKGLEFEHVILFGFNKSNEMVEILRREGRLKEVIYVSITRTNSNLYIIKRTDAIREFNDIDIFEKEESIDDDWF